MEYISWKYNSASAHRFCRLFTPTQYYRNANQFPNERYPRSRTILVRAPSSRSHLRRRQQPQMQLCALHGTRPITKTIFFRSTHGIVRIPIMRGLATRNRVFFFLPQTINGSRIFSLLAKRNPFNNSKQNPQRLATMHQQAEAIHLDRAAIINLHQVVVSAPIYPLVRALQRKATAQTHPRRRLL